MAWRMRPILILTITVFPLDWRVSPSATSAIISWCPVFKCIQTRLNDVLIWINLSVWWLCKCLVIWLTLSLLRRNSSWAEVLLCFHELARPSLASHFLCSLQYYGCKWQQPTGGTFFFVFVFASKHIWGRCCGYMWLLCVLVICGNLMQCDRVPKGICTVVQFGWNEQSIVLEFRLGLNVMDRKAQHREPIQKCWMDVITSLLPL